VSGSFSFACRFGITLLLMTAGSLVMLACAIGTAFRAPRLYRERLAAPLARILLRLWGIRLALRTTEPFPDTQTVFISNHTSTLDLFVLVALGLPNSRFFLSGYLRTILPMGLMGYLMGTFWTVPQHFPARRKTIFQNAARTLRATGESVYLSPEGERVTSGAIGPFNKGAFHLATALRAPVLPLYIRIPADSDPGRGLRVRPGTVEVFTRPAIGTADWDVGDVERYRDRVRGMYVAWNEELRRG
jgi:1-acyl-sn-glycerol-3-phosphate acyltransferase